MLLNRFTLAARLLRSLQSLAVADDPRPFIIVGPLVRRCLHDAGPQVGFREIAAVGLNIDDTAELRDRESSPLSREDSHTALHKPPVGSGHIQDVGAFQQAVLRDAKSRESIAFFECAEVTRVAYEESFALCVRDYQEPVAVSGFERVTKDILDSLLRAECLDESAPVKPLVLQLVVPVIVGRLQRRLPLVVRQLSPDVSLDEFPELLAVASGELGIGL